MARLIKDQILTAIDVGTTKICVLIAKRIGDQIEIIGIGKSPSHGLQKGVVVDVAKTINSISVAVKEAEMMAGFPVESAIIGVSGGHISSVNSTGIVPIKHGQIRQTDVDAVLEAAKAIAISEDRQILHILPQYFTINGQDRVQDPIGMHAVRLEVQAHIIMGAVSSVQNLVNCCQSAGVTVNDIILEQLASADAVLSEDERELGVGVVDIGGGTSDVAFYKNGSVRHTQVVAVAGNHVTNDIAIGLRIMKHEAERVKKRYGFAISSLIETEELVEVEMMHGEDRQVIRLSDLVLIIESRMRELFTLIKEDIVQHSLYQYMTNGIVLTGGGSLLTGARELAEEIFDCPVRIGKPRVLFDLVETLQSPLYATGYGLLVHVLQNEKKIKMHMKEEPLTRRVFERMKSWVSDFF
ncbi:MAG TPA: cell division protein FtsA [Candidatus Babeliales bacterium]|jgi:cell division protein FtsA|nr:cell division protein FtsA [Candidatus Babeliales bacterium]